MLLVFEVNKFEFAFILTISDEEKMNGNSKNWSMVKARIWTGSLLKTFQLQDICLTGCICFRTKSNFVGQLHTLSLSYCIKLIICHVCLYLLNVCLFFLSFFVQST